MFCVANEIILMPVLLFSVVNMEADRKFSLFFSHISASLNSWPEIEVSQRVDLWAQNLKNSKWRFDSIRGAIAEYTRLLLNTSLVIITRVQ